jgi:hypothetical protein
MKIMGKMFFANVLSIGGELSVTPDPPLAKKFSLMQGSQAK